MITKKIYPFFKNKNGYTHLNEDGSPIFITGARIEYRVFGILFYKKTFYSPAYYGVLEYNDYRINF